MTEVAEVAGSSPAPERVEQPELVSRFEVIDETGRAYSRRAAIELHYQDDGRTLKVFVGERIPASPAPEPERNDVRTRDRLLHAARSSPPRFADLTHRRRPMTPHGPHMTHYWLSFCDATRPTGSQFLGCVLVDDATDLADAITRAWVANPGGECKAIAFTDADAPPECVPFWNAAPKLTLLSVSQLRALGLDPVQEPP